MNPIQGVSEIYPRADKPASELPIEVTSFLQPSPSDLVAMNMRREAPTQSLIVQKYGGSSLADAAGIRRSARRIAETQAAGYQVLAVVSAMGDTTDELLDLAASVSSRPRACDLDALLTTGELISMALLAMALADLGAITRTFTGSQAGLITDSLHGKARITDVKPDRIRACLKRGEIAIVAGFQGRSQKERALTTLGRGGSDLTAVVLAAALHASLCEIYTDVDGIYTADPRIVPTARKINVLSSEEMLEFAASGSKILHLRCVEYARRFGVPIHVRSSFVQNTGTLVLPGPNRIHIGEDAGEQPVMSEVVGVNSAARITLVGVPNESGTTTKIFQGLAESGVSVEMIVQNVRAPDIGFSDIVFTLPELEAPAALAVLSSAKATLGFHDLLYNEHVGKVSLSGLGMRSSPGVFHLFFKALSDAGIEMELIEMSETCIGAVTRASQLEDAVRSIRRAFGLLIVGDQAPTRRQVPVIPVPVPVPLAAVGLEGPVPP